MIDPSDNWLRGWGGWSYLDKNEEEFYKIIMDTIKFRRSELGYTQEKVSYMIGGDVKHYGKLENCVKYPSPYTLYKILKALEIDSNELDIKLKLSIKLNMPE